METQCRFWHLFSILLRQLEHPGVKIVFVHFTVTPPLDRHLEHAFGLVFLHEFFETTQERLFAQLTIRFLFLTMADFRRQRHVLQHLLTKDATA